MKPVIIVQVKERGAEDFTYLVPEEIVSITLKPEGAELVCENCPTCILERINFCTEIPEELATIIAERNNG